MLLRYLRVIKDQSFDSGYEMNVISSVHTSDFSISGVDNSYAASGYRRSAPEAYTSELVDVLPKTGVMLATDVRQVFAATCFRLSTRRIKAQYQN